MTSAADVIEIDEAGFGLSAGLVSWDTEVFQFPVAQICQIQIDDVGAASAAWHQFDDWLEDRQVRIVSCRLPMDCLAESMFLEACGFRFVEVVLHPYLDRLDQVELSVDDLVIAPAGQSDVNGLIDIARRAFLHERYHVDPRIDSAFGKERYARWVRSSLRHESQRLLKVVDGETPVGFFIVETDSLGGVYWHLTAISTEMQGRGYGRRAWTAMLNRHRQEGARSVSTTISVRNVAVQNLYARLGFRFRPPDMTFHWVRASV